MGQYASESDVICEGLLMLEEAAGRFDQWVREEVVPALDALDTDPSRAVSLDEAEAMLDEEYRKAVRRAG